ncbi:MAG: class I SAM-dependent methyltransferase [Vicinamibacteria bacterium]
MQRFIVRDVQAALGGVRGRVLDVGCGGRPYEPFVEPGGRYFGLDAQRTAASVPDAWGSAVRLPIADRSIDAVLCTQVLEHVPDPPAVILEAARVLRPGGRLILTAPQAWCLHEAPHDYFRFTRYGLEALCRSAGLAPELVRPQGGFGAGIGTSLIMFVGTLALRGVSRLAAASADDRAGRTAPPREAPPWSRVLWPLRLPMAVLNLAFAALDLLPQGGEFAVNHIVVARKGDGPSGGRAA